MEILQSAIPSQWVFANSGLLQNDKGFNILEPVKPNIDTVSRTHYQEGQVFWPARYPYAWQKFSHLL